MANSPVHSLRIAPELKRQIDRARGGESLSATRVAVTEIRSRLP